MHAWHASTAQRAADLHPNLFILPLAAAKFPAFPALVALCLLGLLWTGYGYFRARWGLVAFGVALTFVASYASFASRRVELAFHDLEIPAWGALLALGMVAAWVACSAMARRAGMDRKAVENCFVLSGLAALLAARIGYVIVTLHEVPRLEWFAFRQGGLLGMSGLVGALAAAGWFTRAIRSSFWLWLDTMAPCFALGVVLVRLGCYLEGCDFGLPLSVDAPAWLETLGRFPRWGDPDVAPVFGAPAWIQQVQSGSLDPSEVVAHAVHPIQLYEAVGGALCVGLCWYLIPRRRFHGQVGLTLLFVYSLMRFVLEALRGDAGRGLLGPYLDPKVYLPLGLLLFATAFSYGPALSVQRLRTRYLAIAASTLPAALALLGTWQLAPSATQLSATQWLSLPLTFAAAHAWLKRAAAPSLTAELSGPGVSA